ncbi:MAG TPA: hypothetical protein VK009_15240 [Chloroflexota bacterium]|nr:hypothetical protein [Chloroflexota bacterium]
MGHVMECLWLSQALEATGACHTRFLTPSATPGSRVLLDHGCDVVQFEQHELHALHALADGWQPEAIVASLFDRDAEHYRQLQHMVPTLIAVFDDGRARGQLSSYLVDYCVEQEIAASDRQARGPHFALLDPALANYPEPSIPEIGRRIFVNQGGSDPFSLTLDILQAISGVRPHCDVFVVLGPAVKPQLAAQVDALRAELPYCCEIEHAVAPQRMYELAASCDLAVTAAGNTLYELCTLGIPSIVVCHHERHARVAKAFHERGAAVSLGLGRQLDPTVLTQAISRLLTGPEERQQLSANARRLVDGRGCQRVAEQIIAWLQDGD